MINLLSLLRGIRGWVELLSRKSRVTVFLTAILHLGIWTLCVWVDEATHEGWPFWFRGLNPTLQPRLHMWWVTLIRFWVWEGREVYCQFLEYFTQITLLLKLVRTYFSVGTVRLFAYMKSKWTDCRCTVANPQRGLVWNVNFHLYPTNIFLI